MKPNSLRWLPVLCLSLIPASSLAQQTAHVASAKSTTAKPAMKVTPGTQLFYGNLPISTESKDSKEDLEMALDRCGTRLRPGHDARRNGHAFGSKVFARLCLWAFAARHSAPAPDVFAKAKALSTRCTHDECLLISFLNGVQDPNVLPAVSAMNGLLARRPRISTFCTLPENGSFSQGDYQRAMQIWSNRSNSTPTSLRH